MGGLAYDFTVGASSSISFSPAAGLPGSLQAITAPLSFSATADVVATKNATATAALAFSPSASEVGAFVAVAATSLPFAPVAAGGRQLIGTATTPLVLAPGASEVGVFLAASATSVALAPVSGFSGVFTPSATTTLAFAPMASTGVPGVTSLALTGTAFGAKSVTLSVSDSLALTGSIGEFVTPFSISAAGAVALGGVADADIDRWVSQSLSGTLALGDVASVAATRSLAVVAADSLVASDMARSGAALTWTARATSGLVLSDVAASDGIFQFSLSASSQVALRAGATSGWVRFATVGAFGTLALGGVATISVAAGRSATSSIAFVGAGSEVGIFVPTATTPAAFAPSASGGRVINVSAVTSLQASQPADRNERTYAVAATTPLAFAPSALGPKGKTPAVSGVALVGAAHGWTAATTGSGLGGVPGVLSGSSDGRYPMFAVETHEGTILLSNGIDPVMRWTPGESKLLTAGVESPSVAPSVGGAGYGTITGKRAALVRFVDSRGRVGNPSPISQVVDMGTDAFIDDLVVSGGLAVIRSDSHGLSSGQTVLLADTRVADGQQAVSVIDAHSFSVSARSAAAWNGGGTWSTGVAQVTYSSVPVPTSSQIVRRQILRNLAGTDTYYVDIDTTDLTSSTFSSSLDDAALAAREPAPLATEDGTPDLFRHESPPSHHPVYLMHGGMVFAAGSASYSTGNAQVALGSTTVSGVGTSWQASFVGRMFSAAGGQYEIVAVDSTSQKLTLGTPYTGDTSLFAEYAIVADRATRRTVRWGEPDNPEAWPAWNSLTIPEDFGDEVTGLVTLGPTLYVVKQHSVYRVVYSDIRDASVYHAAARGCVSQRCIAVAEGVAYMLDEEGIHKFSGSSEPISDVIRDVWYSDGQSTTWQLDLSADRTLWNATVDPSRTTIRWFVTMIGLTPLTTAICYDYRTGRFWMEEYPWAVSSSCQGSVPYRRSIGGIECRRVVLLSEGDSDVVPSGGTLGGTLDGATATTLHDSTASFAAGLGGTPVAIISGDGRHQVAVIAANDGQTLTLSRSLAKVPAPGDSYQLGGIHWRWKSDWLNVEQSEDQVAQDLCVAYRPPAGRANVDASLYYDFATSPKLLGYAADSDGVSTEDGTPFVSFDLSHPRPTPGLAFWRMAGHQADLYSYGDQRLSVRLEGIQGGGGPVRIYELAIRGVSQGR